MPYSPIVTPKEALQALATARENNTDLDPLLRRTLTTVIRQAEYAKELERKLAAARGEDGE